MCHNLILCLYICLHLPVEDLIEIKKNRCGNDHDKISVLGVMGSGMMTAAHQGCAFHSTPLIEILLISIEHYGIHSGMSTFANNAF